ncbi:MAG: hypothetical protein WBF17_23585, partial [Phycisphaerae bacterium]
FDELDRQIRDLQKWFQHVEATTYRAEALILEGDRDPVDIVLRRTEALLRHLKGKLPPGALADETSQLDALKRRGGATPVKDGRARFAVHQALCRLRRKIAFRNRLLSFDEVLFIKKHRSRRNHMCDQYFGFTAVIGGGVYVLKDPFGRAQDGPFGTSPTVRDVLAEATCRNGRFEGKKLVGGAFLSPDLSYDGKTILFAYTEAEPTQFKWSPRSTWHVFRVNVDGTGLRQLTDGKTNDFDPCWLPDGRIVFNSERRGGFGRCHERPVPIFALHTMNDDGGDIRTISLNESNEWHPSVDNSGMIVYTRWDYWDRGFNQAHHPWVTTPDGRDARVVHGNFRPNQGAAPLMEMDVRAIPGSNRYIATAAAHHNQAYGSLILIDPDVEDDDRMSPVRRITPEEAFPEAEGGGHQSYATAWPLDEDFCLCVYDAAATGGRGRGAGYGIYLVDAFGNKELLYRDPKISCLSPIPLRPRNKPPVVSHLARPAQPARWTSPVAVPDAPSQAKRPQPAPLETPPPVPVAVMNVYDGLLPLPEGTVLKQLRIVQVLPKSSPIHNVPFIGYGREKGARAVLGTVPVEADGSVHFVLPAGKTVYFQVLDERGLAVQSMRSSTYVHAGQRLTCQGCHDRRHRAPAQAKHVPLALRREPSRIKPDVDGSNPFSFPRLVQPVLEKHCLPCHMKNPQKAPDLRRGDWASQRTRHYTSYVNLQKHAFFYGAIGYGYDGWTPPRTIPGKFGARASKLLAMLEKGHNKVKLPPEDLHRLTL